MTDDVPAKRRINIFSNLQKSDIMTTSVMRAQLIAYLADADDKKITGLYALLEDTMQERASSSLTKEQLNFLDGDRKKHLSGESVSHSWEEVKEMIRQKKLRKCSGW